MVAPRDVRVLTKKRRVGGRTSHLARGEGYQYTYLLSVARGGNRSRPAGGRLCIAVVVVMASFTSGVFVLLLEIFVGLASFTACLVAVDKLYLFYARSLIRIRATRSRMLTRSFHPTGHRFLQAAGAVVPANGPCAQVPATVEEEHEAPTRAGAAAHVQRDVRRAARHRLRLPNGVSARPDRGAVPG